jgi:RNA polymerase sigma factor (sigma-70 family)
VRGLLPRGTLTAEGRALVEKYADMALSAGWRFYERTPARDLDELQAVAYEGLCNAVERWPRYCQEHGYDPADHSYLGAFLNRRVNGAVLDWSRNQDWVTRTERHTLKALEQAQDDLRDTDGAAVTLAAARSGRTEDQVRAAQTAAAVFRPLSLEDGPLGTSEDWSADANLASPQDDVESQAEVNLILGQFSAALGRLDQAERDLITFVYFYEMKLGEAAGLLGLDPAEAARLHEHAVLTLHSALLLAAGGGTEPARPPPQPVEITVSRHDGDFGYATEDREFHARTCPLCNEVFWTLDARQRFCSDNHRRKAYRREERRAAKQQRELSAARP